MERVWVMSDAEVVARLFGLLVVSHLVGTWTFAMPRRAGGEYQGKHRVTA